MEIEVEKQLKLSGKKDIETFGVEKFNRLCRESVFRYKADWEQLSDRIGYWLDYSHPYVTYTNDYIETVWWLLSRLHEKDLLYRGHRVLPYCPRCGTVLSSHELALGYEETKDKSIYLTFPLVGSQDIRRWSWSSGPRPRGPCPSNVAAAVNPDLITACPRSASREGRQRSAAGDRRVTFGGGEAMGPARQRGSARGHAQGERLVGREYLRPLDIVDLPEGSRHSVVMPGAFVTAEDGSGIVHLAPAFGADDYAAGQTHGLELLRPVAPDGTFRGTSWPELEGRLVTADETNELIIRRLKEAGRLLLDRAARPQLSPLLALPEQADLLRPRFLVRPHFGGEGPDARLQPGGRLAPAGGRGRTVR